MGLFEESVNKKRHALKPNKRRRVLLRARGICEIVECFNQISENCEIHHIKQVQFGGTDDLENLAAICKYCHLKISQAQDYIDKHQKLLFEIPFSEEQRKNHIKKEIKIKQDFLDTLKFKNRKN